MIYLLLVITGFVIKMFLIKKRITTVAYEWRLKTYICPINYI